MNSIEYSEQIKQWKHNVLEKYRQKKGMTCQKVFRTEPQDIIELMKELTGLKPINNIATN